MPLTDAQLTGLDDSHLVELHCGQRLQREAAHALAALQADAEQAGFDMAVASGFRSFARQLVIWNGKARGIRPVLDDQGCSLDVQCLSPVETIYAILRYSALPGASRHHWGTDLDVFDAAVMPVDYQLQLSPAEVAPGGLFDPLHCWLDKRIAAGQAYGFFRPYAQDHGGVAPERWHLSYAPLSDECAVHLHKDTLRLAWNDPRVAEALMLRDEVEADLEQILARYVVTEAIGK